MPQTLTKGEQNLILLNSLIPGNEQFYIWGYNTDGTLINTSCPDPDREILERFFLLFGGLENMLARSRGSDHEKPFLIGSPVGVQWAVVFDRVRERENMIVVGPVFYSVPSESQVSELLRSYIGRYNKEASTDVLQIIRRLPVMSYAIFARYTVLVHNTVNEQQLGLTALDHKEIPFKEDLPGIDKEHNRNLVYQTERAMLQMVRNGDINYQKALQNAISSSPGVPVSGRDPLRQAKTSVIVFTSLVCRAAMEGGLSPEVAYPLGDSYIQSVEDCRDSEDLNTLSNAMYHDFVYRVHYLNSNPGYSHAIQKCCDYIELSLNKRIRTSDLASMVGYTEYYLTTKFKKETGQSVSSYIRSCKVERAKLILETTDMTVKAIAEDLAFNTTNYFIQIFRETTGLTPNQYRELSR